MLIDTHCHLSEPEFDADRDAVIERARTSGVQKIILIGTDLASSQRAVALAKRYPFFWATVGLHPHETKEMNESLLDALEQLSRHPKVVGWGETGLDFYYNHSSPEAQRRGFIEQIRSAKKALLPLVIHTRDAWKETFEILAQEKAEGHIRDVGGVFHCFTGDRAVAQRAVESGFYLSFSGILTFPKAAALQEAASAAPIDKILIETDAPYLSPQGYRGKRNEPAFVRAVAEKLGALRGISFQEISRVTAENAERLFKLAPKPPSA